MGRITEILGNDSRIQDLIEVGPARDRGIIFSSLALMLSKLLGFAEQETESICCFLTKENNRVTERGYLNPKESLASSQALKLQFPENKDTLFIAAASFLLNALLLSNNSNSSTIKSYKGEREVVISIEGASFLGEELLDRLNGQLKIHIGQLIAVVAFNEKTTVLFRGV